VAENDIARSGGGHDPATRDGGKKADKGGGVLRGRTSPSFKGLQVVGTRVETEDGLAVSRLRALSHYSTRLLLHLSQVHQGSA